jgi:hypothetical protein
MAVVAACSSSNDSGDGGDDASDSARPPRPDSGFGDAAVSCLGSAPANYPFSNARKRSGACSQAVIDQINAATTVSAVFDILDAAPQSCRDCTADSLEADPEWGPFVVRGTVSAPTGTPINWGGCAQAAGFNDGCSKAFQAAEDCFFVACFACGSSEEYDACVQEAVAFDSADSPLNGPCAGKIDAYRSACRQRRQVQQACATIGAVISQICGPASADGGTEGGADGGDDGGDDAEAG